MTVKYEENESGIYWVEGDQKGEPQKDLHHAMKDYENVQYRKANTNAADTRVHTGDDGGPAEGQLADNNGSAGESQEADGSGGTEGTL